MGIYTKNLEFAEIVEMPNGIAICYKHPEGFPESYHAIRIETPEQAHELRVAVNKACNIIMGTKKGGAK